MHEKKIYWYVRCYTDAVIEFNAIEKELNTFSVQVKTKKNN